MNVLDIITTALEVAGFLALAIAAALAVATFSTPAAVAVGGIALIAVSAVLSAVARHRTKAAKR